MRKHQVVVLVGKMPPAHNIAPEEERRDGAMKTTSIPVGARRMVMGGKAKALVSLSMLAWLLSLVSGT
jgi:hypothetical protein